MRPQVDVCMSEITLQIFQSDTSSAIVTEKKIFLTKLLWWPKINEAYAHYNAHIQMKFIGLSLSSPLMVSLISFRA